MFSLAIPLRIKILTYWSSIFLFWSAIMGIWAWGFLNISVNLLLKALNLKFCAAIILKIAPVIQIGGSPKDSKMDRMNQKCQKITARRINFCVLVRKLLPFWRITFVHSRTLEDIFWNLEATMGTAFHLNCDLKDQKWKLPLQNTIDHDCKGRFC